MKLAEAIKRLRFTILKQNKPNQNDAEALNKILELLSQNEEKTLQENLLFAKLYSFLLCEFLKNYTDVNFANKQINKILSEPMDLRLQLLQMELKQKEILNYFNSINILDPFLKDKTVSELIKISETHSKNIPKLKPSQVIKISESWNNTEVLHNLNTNINLSIQNFKNYV